MPERTETQPDPIAALGDYLRGRLGNVPVYGYRLDRRPGMPKDTVLLSPSSGEDNRNWETMDIDVICFGKSMSTAGRIRNRASGHMRNLNRQVFTGCLLHCATLETGPISYVDTTDGWPSVIETWRVNSSLEPAT